jgi:hypothetical protein
MFIELHCPATKVSVNVTTGAAPPQLDVPFAIPVTVTGALDSEQFRVMDGGSNSWGASVDRMMMLWFALALFPHANQTDLVSPTSFHFADLGKG